MKKIAVYSPYFAGGGAEAVSLCIIDALQKDYEVTLFTFLELDFKQLNKFYNTNIDPKKIELRTIFPKTFTQAVNFLRANNKYFRILMFHLPLAKMREDKDKYDLLISGFNGADLGKKGIQYIHWTKIIEGGNKNIAIHKFYQNLFKFKTSQIKENISVCNSDFVAEKVKKDYQINASVIYPPVMLENSSLPWEEKENAFICSGRLVIAKAQDQIIKILKDVRDKGFDLKLYITTGAAGIYASKYQKYVKKLVKENSDWIKLYENLSYQEYLQVLNKCKYGIHHKSEAFGISVAEILKVGAIPFVRSQGGQTEILGKNNSDLFFNNRQDAVNVITNILGDQAKQEKLLISLQKQKDLFSQDLFYQQIKNLVANYFASA